MEVSQLNEKRKQAGLSIDELSKRANLPKSTVEKVLFGVVKYPRIDTMQAIKRALELNTPTTWTEEEKALGVAPNNLEKLSPDEMELLDAYRAIKDEKGEKAAKAIRTLVLTYLDK